MMIIHIGTDQTEGEFFETFHGQLLCDSCLTHEKDTKNCLRNNWIEQELNPSKTQPIAFYLSLTQSSVPV
jgi:hypothetical protein